MEHLWLFRMLTAHNKIMCSTIKHFITKIICILYWNTVFIAKLIMLYFYNYPFSYKKGCKRRKSLNTFCYLRHHLFHIETKCLNLASMHLLNMQLFSIVNCICNYVMTNQQHQTDTSEGVSVFSIVGYSHKTCLLFYKYPNLISFKGRSCRYLAAFWTFVCFSTAPYLMPSWTCWSACLWCVLCSCRAPLWLWALTCGAMLLQKGAACPAGKIICQVYFKNFRLQWLVNTINKPVKLKPLYLDSRGTASVVQLCSKRKKKFSMFNNDGYNAMYHLTLLRHLMFSFSC